MKNKFKKIALTSSVKNKDALSIAKQCYEILSGEGLTLLLDKSFDNLASALNINSSSEEHIIKNSDLVIAIGGDGTMLDFLRKYGSRGIPILGINLGSLGFLTDIAPGDLNKSLREIVNGNFIEDSRSFLTAKIKGKVYKAINEVVLHSGAVAKMIEFDLLIDNSLVYSQKSDGLIISTTTGSTAYSLSAGGPIIHPEIDSISIIPMFPHSLSSSPFLVRKESKIKIDLKKMSSKAFLSFDGSELVKVNKGQVVTINASSKKFKLIHPEGHDFFQACKTKLGWGQGIIKS